MLKIIKIIFIVVLSVASSTATTVVLMLRYTRPVENITGETNTVSSQAEHSEQRLVGSVEKVVESLVKPRGFDMENAGSAQHQPSAARYFDYALLSKDMAAFSETVGRFNEILSREIQKLREGAASGENTSP